MRAFVLALACLACTSHGRRVKITGAQLEDDSNVEQQHAQEASTGFGFSAEVSTGFGFSSALASNKGESIWQSPEVQKVLTLLCICVVGVILKGRFPGKERAVVQKLLLQVFVPATLFRDLSKERLEWSHINYLAGGATFFLCRLLCATLVSYGVFGSKPHGKLANLRRTGMFELSTVSCAQSVLPYLGEFVAPRYVGLGGIVDLPMKMYMLLFMPFAMKAVAEDSIEQEGESQEPPFSRKVLALFQDPVSLALILGLIVAAITDGGGLKALHFAGTAIDALANAQTPVLFFLIGLKIEFQSSTPIMCLVLLLAMYGSMMIALSVLFLIVRPPSLEIMQMMILFAQGAPSVVGLGVITKTVESGMQGFSPDFAFDLVGISFPISAVLQCAAGSMGKYWVEFLPVIGGTLLVVAISLRFGCRSVFQESADGAAQAKS